MTTSGEQSMLELSPSAHVDTFSRDSLPPPNQWPDLQFTLPALSYGQRINCATELLRGHDGRRPCLITPSQTYTYDDIRELSAQIAHVLIDDQHLVPGNRVLLHAANVPMLVASWLAVLRAGLLAVTTAPQLSHTELAVIGQSACVDFALVADELVETVASAGLPSHLAFTDLADRAASKERDFRDVKTAADDVALLAFTSGTTGKPKGTMHFHRDVLAIADTFSANVLRPGSDDIFAGSPPLGFTFGLGALVVFPLRVGAASLLLPRAIPDVLLPSVVEHGVTRLFTAPTAYRKMLDDAGPMPALRSCVSAGEPMTQHTWNAWRELTGIGIVDGIGTTELLHIFVCSGGHNTPAGAIGKAVPGYQVALFDDELELTLPGETGHLAVRGPTGCRYLSDPRQTQYVRHGWNITGDLCVRDEDGFIWYRSRSDDMIVTAGYTVAPAEVEMALLQHGDVVECGVVGVPHPTRTMLIRAFVVLRPDTVNGADMPHVLRTHCNQFLASYKVPHEIQVVGSIPRTSTGKVQRFRLRDATSEHKR